MMKIATYLHPFSTAVDVTGVGKHILNMADQLSKRADVEQTLLVDERAWSAFPAAYPDSILLKMPVKTIRTRRPLIEKSWSLLGWPNVERWTGDVDWVYAPVEAHLPTKKAHFAITSHCMFWFEKDLPLYQTSRVERFRWRMRLFQTFRSKSVLWLSVSEFHRQRLHELFQIPLERIEIVGNGVEQVFYDAGLQKTDYTGRPYLLMVGGLRHWKGAEEIIQLADRLRERKSDIVVRIAGRCEEQYQSRIANHSHLEMLGYKGIHNGLVELMRDALALFHPTYYDTFGIPVAEAMAAGTPVIAANNTAIPEVMGTGGILVDSLDADRIMAEANRLLSDVPYRSDLIARARQESQRHTWTRCVERLLTAFRSRS